MTSAAPGSLWYSVLQALPDAVVLLDDALAVVDCNAVARDRLGPACTAGGALLARVHPQDEPALVAALTRARAQAGWTTSVRVRVGSAPETWTPFVVRAARVEEPQEGLVLLVQEATSPEPTPWLASATLLHEVASAAPVALLAMDLAGTIRFAAGDVLQVAPETLVGRSLLELAPTPERQAVLRRALAGERLTTTHSWGGHSWRTEFRPVAEGGALNGTVAVYTDVTGQLEAERAPAAGEASLHGVLEAANEAIIVLDPQARIRSANARCSALFGAPVLPGMSLHELVDEQTAALLEMKLPRRASGQGERYELPLRDTTGALIWLLVSASPLLSEDGAFLGSVAVLTDITAHKAIEQRLERLALVDAVTGVASRATLADRLQHALDRRTTGIVAVMFCDVDRLKETNDRLGHVAGDALLRQVAARISAALRPEDTVARFGGDEFVVVCEELHNTGEASAMAERVRAAVAQPLSVGDGTVTPTVSIGVAVTPVPGSPDGLLAAADAAAYMAKRAGGNTVRLR